MLAPTAPGEPFVRSAADEEADTAEASKNLLDLRFKEWPDEAGFDVLVEHRGPIPLPVTGTIPAWAAGSLFRTGPGLSHLADTARGEFRVSHWFDGFAHSHRFDILPPEKEGSGGDGLFLSARVAYSSRRQAEKLMDHIRREGTHPGMTFAQRADPCVGLFAKVASVFRPDFPCPNVDVVVHPNLPDFEKRQPAEAGPHASSMPSNLWLSTDAAVMLRVSPDTLEPAGPVTRHAALHPALDGPLSAAHGQRDPATGDFFNFNTRLGRGAVHRVFRLRADTGETEILAEIRDGDPAPAPPCYVHSLFLTENFVVLCLPAARYRLAGLRIMWERNLLDAMLPFDSRVDRCRWFVVDRRGGGGVVARFESPAGFFFHTVNAFEEGRSIFADVVEYRNHDIMHAFYYDNILNRDGRGERFWSEGQRHRTALPELVRYRLGLPGSHPDAGSGTLSGAAPAAERIMRIPAPHVGELPTINPAFSTRRARYVYSGAARGLSAILMDSLVKTDMDRREAVFWAGPDGHTPGEPIFVARPAEGGGTGEEDDGVILSVVLDGRGERSYLLCLDARTMREVGRAECGFPVPFGFHGAHVRGRGGGGG